ncbi:pyrroloquinoline quinone biosynthesis peptide chaperone PqqD [Streptomyces sp. HSW2009]|uniref:pyrroloquinoline quinone biosynthesis peptide chaperone PqqD n=1 Tax=Streptomyces sp. HSW2009 TaxID=3142890 RepID=UPI0032EC488C
MTATPVQPTTAEQPGPGGEGAAPATRAAGPVIDTAWRPALSASVLLRRDRVRQTDLLVLPERVVVRAGSAAEVLRLCDGRRDVATLVAELAGRHPGAPVADEVPRFLTRLRDAGWLR